MNIFVYGDESGVFDKEHNDIFVFGGVVFLDKEDRDLASRMFISAEDKIRGQYDLSRTGGELKGMSLKPRHKTGLFRSLSRWHRYAFIVNQRWVNDNVFSHKKTKQRYLDYVYKVGLKRMLGRCIEDGEFSPQDVDNLYVRFDEHTTATDGCYELAEGIEQEFKHGTFNYSWNTFHPPLFPDMSGEVSVTFTDSKTNALIRASDIVANVALFYERTGMRDKLESSMFVTRFP